MNAQPQVRCDSQLIREVLSFGGGIPHWQMATTRELDLDDGSELHPIGGALFNDDLCATMDDMWFLMFSLSPHTPMKSDVWP
jgi:hypothetical protein